MATISIQHPRHIGNRNGLTPITRGGAERPEIKEAASQSFVVGDALKDSSGSVALATAASNILAAFKGFATKKATGVTGDPVRYKPVQPGDRFIMNIKGTSTTTLAAAQRSQKYMLDIDSGKVVVNPDAAFDATKPHVIVEELYTIVAGYRDGDVIGDTYGRVVVFFPDQQGLQG